MTINPPYEGSSRPEARLESEGFEVVCLASEAFCDSVELRPWRIFQPIRKAKKIKLALSGRISGASVEFGVEWSNKLCVEKIWLQESKKCFIEFVSSGIISGASVEFGVEWSN